MASGNHTGTVSRIHILLAGLESGVIGGLAMLAWLALVSLWYGRSVWSISNLLATTFYGNSAFRRGFRWATLSGLGLHVVVNGLLGIAFGFAVSGVASRLHVRVLGLLFGIAWYYLWFGFLWKHVNPLVPLYSPERGMIIAHFALGAFLGSFPKYLRSVAGDDSGLSQPEGPREQ